jgi:hypothetical protein
MQVKETSPIAFIASLRILFGTAATAAMASFGTGWFSNGRPGIGWIAGSRMFKANRLAVNQRIGNFPAGNFDQAGKGRPGNGHPGCRIFLIQRFQIRQAQGLQLV